MKIPCRQITAVIKETLRKQISDLKKQSVYPKLLTFLPQTSPEQQSFVSIKKRVASEIGAEFELHEYSKPPSFDNFVADLKIKVGDPQTTGVIVQHPLPKDYDQIKLYDTVPMEKEIEGHKPDSPFFFPLSLSVLTGIKYIIMAEEKRNIDETIIIKPQEDKSLFAEYLKNKSVVIAGRGPTGGGPIAEAFVELGIKYQVVHSETPDPDKIFLTADFIVTATGRQLINKKNIKPGVVLLNVGLRKENGKLRGDYDEQEIEKIASYYTETPGGLGPLDVMYLYINLIEAARLEKIKPVL
ncbi:hypothetical protein A3H85_00610 [Candidatus Daviesbacteria bacterium RIFCSPLOWO2_02_FULL_40_8]|nr:MAG: hypothetical protein A3H85_00610 [Candidatus Daviesbacteria bacterium RIFCSPLOWO2_02_FULL_40_8]